METVDNGQRQRALRAPWPQYRTLWIWLMLGWTVSAADRALTGPVVTWMIDNDVAFLADASKPYALGGLIGGLFFAGYMLTQWPGGYWATATATARSSRSASCGRASPRC
jgi:MFS transporter, ACS family, D-galactonate transporter